MFNRYGAVAVIISVQHNPCLVRREKKVGLARHSALDPVGPEMLDACKSLARVACDPVPEYLIPLTCLISENNAGDIQKRTTTHANARRATKKGAAGAAPQNERTNIIFWP